ncbi:MAG: transcriptional regulator [Chlorobi bacterium]|nr:transcriptional regulator [Chlorobiota bacterium]
MTGAIGPLVDFLNHGILPFTGRAAEIERLMAFWRSTVDAHGLRVLQLTGEAGGGKSRILEETIPAITGNGGLVIHVKLYPAAATSLSPLIARALGRSGGARALLGREIEENLSPVIDALRRLARLRPTLLVIEDAHLLSRDAVADLSIILASLADETISVLTVARPVEQLVTAAVSPYLTEEMALEGLDADGLNTLWIRLFGSEAEREIIAALHRVTAGNLLAVRTALRSLYGSGALEHAQGIFRLAISPSSLASMLEQNVGLLAEGMSAHLTAEDRHAAQQFASLGEVFAMEAAEALVEDAHHLIRQLQFKGVLAAAPNVIAPLPEEASRLPLIAFTHTLIHRHIVQDAKLNTDGMIRLIARGLPLYSTLPFQLISGDDIGSGLAAREVSPAFFRSMRIAQALDLGSDWEMAEYVHAAGVAMLEAIRERSDANLLFMMETRMVSGRLLMLRRSEDSGEYERLMLNYLDLTAGDLPPNVAAIRISALSFKLRFLARRDYAGCDVIREEVEALVARIPEIRFNGLYVEFLSDVAHLATEHSDMATLRSVERRVHELMADPGATENFRNIARQRIMKHFLTIYDTPGELAERRALLADLQHDNADPDLTLLTAGIIFLDDLGAIDELIETIDRVLPECRRRGHRQTVISAGAARLCALATRGADPATIEEEMRALITSAPEADGALLRLNFGRRLVPAALLLGRPEWARSLADILFGDPDALAPDDRIILAAMEERLADELPRIATDRAITPPLKRFCEAIIAGSPIPVAVLDEVRALLATPLLRLGEIAPRIALIELISLADRRGDRASLLHAEAHGALTACLELLSMRSLDDMMRHLIGRHGALLEPGDQARWHGRVQEIADERAGSAVAKPVGGLLSLSLLGTIEARGTDGEMLRLRGARLRALVGMMVANEMLATPLSHREFCRLALGDDNIDRAKRALPVAVHRLRDVLGAAAILTDAETPRLDPSIVKVDLLEAHRELTETRAALRSGSLIRAHSSLRRALEIIGGDVPFPSLYDDFFEALREDFENRLRDAVLGLSRELLREGDAVSAAEILRSGSRMMAGDDEIAELLCRALETSGDRTEAARVRMRSVEDVPEG